MSIPILAATAFVGCAVTFLITGPVFSVEVFKPDLKKFNPVENIKQKFKLRTLIELLKNMLKIAIATYIVYDIIYRSLPTLIKTVSMNLMDSMQVFQHFLFQAVLELWILFIVIAVMDLIFQKKDFAKQMKMEKFEVKQEYKNTEGDPQIKSKRKQIAQEIAYSDGPAAAVQKGKAVVTNPTHLAIVLGYEREIDAAPYILAMVQDKMAEHVIKLAEQYNVPIMRNIPLAHKLWDEGELYQYVPEDTYDAVAEIIRWVWALQEQADRMEYEE
jgi:flagellar biosynthesis protein FlhB